MVLIAVILSSLAMGVIQKVAINQLNNALGLADNTKGLFSNVAVGARYTRTGALIRIL
jgi:hypothetical protein